MPSPRAVPPLPWLCTYLSAVGLDMAPERAQEALDATRWRRLRAAWRAHQYRQREAAKPHLSRRGWAELEMLRRRLGCADLDETVRRMKRGV